MKKKGGRDATEGRDSIQGGVVKIPVNISCITDWI